MNSLKCGALIVSLAYGATAHIFAQSPPIRFENIVQETGIDFIHSNGRTGKDYIFESICSGLAVFDFDNDGWMDVYLLSGNLDQGDLGTDARPSGSSRLYRNLSGFRFQDVTELAGVGDSGHSVGATCGDFDNDGDADLYVSNYGPNVFFRNEGDGTFSRLADAPRAQETRVGAGVAFLDIEGDGDLDLFVGNYIQFSYEQQIDKSRFGVRLAQGPQDFPPDPDQLFCNNGDGTFTDVSGSSGIGELAGPSMGVVAFDYNQDGDTDLFLCHDTKANFLWDNDGQGHFSEIALITGVAYGFSGAAQANMGVDCGDYNRDGWLDLVSTNFKGEVPNLYRNSHGEYFDDVGMTAGLGAVGGGIKWGVCLADFDNDMFQDLFVVSGRLTTLPHESELGAVQESRDQVFRNLAGMTFADVTAAAGQNVAGDQPGRAAAADDLDNDGDLDVLILNFNSTTSVFRNDSQQADSHWLQIKCVGTGANRDAAGSRIVVCTAGAEQVQEIHRGRGYQSHYGDWLHFGMGKTTSIERIEVYWHGGVKETFRNVALDTRVTLVQGQGAR